MDKEQLLLEVYKTHSAHSHDITKIRDGINAFYLAFHAIFIPYISQKHLIYTLLGIALCVLWLGKVEYFTKLNTAKIKCLSELEKQLGFDFYDKEWDFCKKAKGNIIFNTIEVSSGIISQLLPMVIACVYIFVHFTKT